MSRVLWGLVWIMSATVAQATETHCNDFWETSSLERLLEVAPHYQTNRELLSHFEGWIEDSKGYAPSHQGIHDRGEFWIKASLPWSVEQEHVLMSVHVLAGTNPKSQTDDNFQKYNRILLAIVAETNQIAQTNGWHSIRLKSFPTAMAHGFPSPNDNEKRWLWITLPQDNSAPKAQVRATQMKFLELLRHRLFNQHRFTL